MSNNYVLFSESLKVDAADLAWIKAKLRYFENPPDDDALVAWEAYIAECNAYELDAEDAGRGSTVRGLEFDVDFGDDEVIFYAEECGNWFHVAKLVQGLFREFHHNASWFIAWAETCSKARPGQFGGGAAFVTAENVEIFSAYDFIAAKSKDFARQNELSEGGLDA